MKETKVYVDELPESCYICPCYDTSEGFCSMTGSYIKYKKGRILQDCQLIDIKDHDRELVKEVCEKIRSELEKELKYDFTSYVPIMNVCNKINRVLDQTQKEYEK